MSKPYRPSNGTEGEYFMSEHCYQCIHDNPDYDAKSPRCEIMTLTMCIGVDEPEYPKEWCYGEDGKPTCTKFQKWDWDNDGDPTDPDNPKAPIPEDPNQLCLPFIFQEIGIDENDYHSERIAHYAEQQSIHCDPKRLAFIQQRINHYQNKMQ